MTKSIQSNQENQSFFLPCYNFGEPLRILKLKNIVIIVYYSWQLYVYLSTYKRIKQDKIKSNLKIICHLSNFNYPRLPRSLLVLGVPLDLRSARPSAQKSTRSWTISPGMLITIVSMFYKLEQLNSLWCLTDTSNSHQDIYVYIKCLCRFKIYFFLPFVVLILILKPKAANSPDISASISLNNIDIVKIKYAVVLSTPYWSLYLFNSP